MLVYILLFQCVYHYIYLIYGHFLETTPRKYWKCMLRRKRKHIDIDLYPLGHNTTFPLPGLILSFRKVVYGNGALFKPNNGR